MATVIPSPWLWSSLARSSYSLTTCSLLPLARRGDSVLALLHAPAAIWTSHRRFSSTARRERHKDHYATLAVPRNATKAQIKTSYYRLSKTYHPDVAQDNAAKAKFIAASEAYAVLGDERKRREYDRTSGSSSHFLGQHGQHPQATTTRPSQQPGFKHFWPNHPRNRARDPTGSPCLRSKTRPPTRTRPRRKFQSASTRSTDVAYLVTQRSVFKPFLSVLDSHQVHSRVTLDEVVGAGLQAAREDKGPDTTGRPTLEEVAAESALMRALGASGLVAFIMLVAAVIGGGLR
ncbi:hypothetical protein BU15DRAFT_77359 [Melanogaster broomeanus]|nr:hypothetical protein BU15DRAFT_77359 [Melanogaster broomeanus]